MTDLTTYQPTAPAAHVGGIGADTSLTEWVQNLGAAHKIATALCATSFVPQHFRGKPDEAAAAILYGHEVGFSPTTSLQTLYVIGGKPAMYARPMVALVQAAGHEVWTESKTDQSVTVCGKRRGSERVMRETWDIDRAKKAGYTNNKKYQTDPQAMLYARAASDVCRQVAADVLTGIGYSVEEMQLAGKDQPEAEAAPAAKPKGMAGLRDAVAPKPEPEPASAGPIADDIAQCTDTATLRGWWTHADDATRALIEARVAELNAAPQADPTTGEVIDEEPPIDAEDQA